MGARLCESLCPPPCHPPAHSSTHPQEYVRARMGQFGSVLASRLNPTLSELTVQRVTAEVLNSLPPPDYSGAALETKEFQLVFRHDCL